MELHKSVSSLATTSRCHINLFQQLHIYEHKYVRYTLNERDGSVSEKLKYFLRNVHVNAKTKSKDFVKQGFVKKIFSFFDCFSF